MSNNVTLDAVKFECKDGDVTYGFKIYDDYDSDYGNFDDESVMQLGDIELLNHVRNGGFCSDNISAMFDYCRENEKGMTINSTYYDWDEIKEVLT